MQCVVMMRAAALEVLAGLEVPGVRVAPGVQAAQVVLAALTGLAARAVAVEQVALAIRVAAAHQTGLAAQREQLQMLALGPIHRAVGAPVQTQAGAISVGMASDHEPITALLARRVREEQRRALIRG